jgi:hypothetical protein
MIFRYFKYVSLLICSLVVYHCSAINGNQDTLNHPFRMDSVNHGRLNAVIITGGALYASSMAGLYNLWYADYPQSNFHFFNDNNEWLYMDKMGHITTAYWVGRIGHGALRWSGVGNKRATWYGGSLGFVFLATVEIFDGFSAAWGFSPGDFLANTAGTALFIGQQLGWEDQRILMKFSYHETELAQYRPDLLGKSFIQQMLKDYNGQTYWLSANIRSFLPESSKFPRWLNVAFGYGAYGMLGAASNPSDYNGQRLPVYNRYSKYYLSLDFDFTRIKTHSETVRFLLNFIGFIKLPFPTLEYNPEHNFVFHFLYF